MGALPTRIAIYILLAATLLGVIGTVLTKSEPGFLLGLLILVGSVIATLGIRRGAVYVIFPLPTLAFFVGAVITGAVHDRGIDTSKTELGATSLQWIADVFFAMCATTILVVLIAAARWLLSRQFVSGQFQMSAAGQSGGRGPRTAPAPARGQRLGDDRDPWSAADPWDRRPPAPRPPGSGPQPAGPVPPGGRNQPGGAPQPGAVPPGNRPGSGNRGFPPDRGSRGQSDGRGDRNPWGTRGQRPGRDEREPRDPWTQR